MTKTIGNNLSTTFPKRQHKSVIKSTAIRRCQKSIKNNLNKMGRTKIDVIAKSVVPKTNTTPMSNAADPAQTAQSNESGGWSFFGMYKPISHIFQTLLSTFEEEVESSVQPVMKPEQLVGVRDCNLDDSFVEEPTCMKKYKQKKYRSVKPSKKKSIIGNGKKFQNANRTDKTKRDNLYCNCDAGLKRGGTKMTSEMFPAATEENLKRKKQTDANTASAEFSVDAEENLVRSSQTKKSVKANRKRRLNAYGTVTSFEYHKRGTAKQKTAKSAAIKTVSEVDLMRKVLRSGNTY